MKPEKAIFARLFDRSCEIRDEVNAQEQARQDRLGAGDLFLIKMPVPVPVTWCAVSSHSRDDDLWYCVPGDSFSLVSASDVTAPTSTTRSGLHFRCHCGLWIHADDIVLSNRLGRLDGSDLDSIRARVSKLAADPIAILTGEEVSDDPDYVEWIDNLRLAVDALLNSLHNEQAPSVRVIGKESALTPIEQPLSLAAADSTAPASEATGPQLLQRLQVFESAEGALQACAYEDGVILEWHPCSPDFTKPVVLHAQNTVEWVSQHKSWCTHLLPWDGGRVELAINGELVAIGKPPRD